MILYVNKVVRAGDRFERMGLSGFERGYCLFPT